MSESGMVPASPSNTQYTCGINQWRNDGVAAASSDGGPTGGRGPDSSRVLSD